MLLRHCREGGGVQQKRALGANAKQHLPYLVCLWHGSSRSFLRRGPAAAASTPAAEGQRRILQSGSLNAVSRSALGPGSAAGQVTRSPLLWLPSCLVYRAEASGPLLQAPSPWTPACCLHACLGRLPQWRCSLLLAGGGHRCCLLCDGKTNRSQEPE